MMRAEACRNGIRGRQRTSFCRSVQELDVQAPHGRMHGAVLLDLPWVAYEEDGRALDRETHPIFAALRTGEPQAERVLRYPRPDGTLLWIATAAQPLLNAVGCVEGALSYFRDVSAETRRGGARCEAVAE